MKVYPSHEVEGFCVTAPAWEGRNKVLREVDEKMLQAWERSGGKGFEAVDHGRGREVEDKVQAVDHERGSDVEEKGLKLSITEGGMETKSKVTASCRHWNGCVHRLCKSTSQRIMLADVL